MAGSYTRRIQLYINGKEVNNEIRSIKSEMNKLINEQYRMTRGSREYLEAGAKIRTLKGIIQEHNDQLKTTAKSWFNLKAMGDNMNRYFVMFGSFIAGVTGLIFSGKKAITTFAEFDDKVGDVMKTTQLGKEAVMGMNEEFKKMNTRTAQLELLDLARVGGKLGLAKEKDVEGFVKAADKINVALKEDLGGNAEEAVNEIGKLVDIFKVKEQFGIEDSMIKTGSAINALGAASTASEGYIVEFTKRVAGVAPQAKISIENVMGLAATLDSLGQTSEVSSTVYSAVVTGMFQDTETYSKIAGMSVKAFSNLLKKDANEAFIKLLEGLNGNGAGMEELSKKMDDMGLEGKRSIAVLGVLANNTKTLRDQQKLSNNEFEKGTSLINEFNTKNNTAKAKLEKNRKELYNMTVELGEKLMPVLTTSMSGFNYFIKSVSVLTDWFIKYSGSIITVTSAIAVYAVAAKIEAYWMEKTFQARLANMTAAKAHKAAEEAATKATELNIIATKAQQEAEIASAEAKALKTAASKAKKAAELAEIQSIELGIAATEAQALAEKSSVKSKELSIAATNAKKIADNASQKAAKLNIAATEAQAIADRAATKTTLQGTMATKAGELVKRSSTAATLLFAAAKAVLTGNIGRASAAMKVFSSTVGMSPLGIIMSLLSLVTGAFILFHKNSEKARESVNNFYKDLTSEKKNMNDLFEILKKTKTGSEERKKAIEEVNRVYGQYLPSLLSEKSTLIDIEKAQTAANKALIQAVALKSKESTLQEIINESSQTQMESMKEMVSSVESKKGASVAGLFQNDLMKLFEESDRYTSIYDKKLQERIGEVARKYNIAFINVFEGMKDVVSARKKEKEEVKSLNDFYDAYIGSLQTVNGITSKSNDLNEQIRQKRIALARAETKDEKQEIQAEIKRLEALKKDSEKTVTSSYTRTDKSKKKYSLTDDLKYTQELYILKNRFLDGDIKTEEEYNRQKLDLDIKYLDLRIKANKDKEQELSDIKQDFADKKLEKKKAEDKRLEALTEASKAADSELQKEKESYAKKLKELDLYGKTKEQMTDLELKAYESLTSEHLKKLDKLDADAIKAEIERRQQAFESGLQDLRMKNADELSQITSLEQAKALLSDSMSSEELDKIKNLEQAKKALKKKYQADEEKYSREHLNELLKQLQEVMASGKFENIALSDSLLSEEEKKILTERINEVKKLLGNLDTTSELSITDNTDLLGFSSNDWDIFFNNLQSGKIGIDEIAMATQALGNVWKSYNDFVSAGEQRQLKQFEKSQNKKKETLKKQLDAGLVSQENYNKSLEDLDAETERKKAKFDRDAAVRERNIALMSAIVNTSVAVTKALPNLILAALVGAAGAFQIGTILSTPLPEMPGAEEGGFINVRRSQDGKLFNAKHDPRKRGYVSGATIIVGEKPNSSEYVVSDAGVNNPTVRPVLDILEMARQNGNLAQINLPAILNSMYPSFSGRERGGYADIQNSEPAKYHSIQNDSNTMMMELIRQNTLVMQDLRNKLGEKLTAEVSLKGKNGILERMQELESLTDNANL